jgi:hypothetical protein
MVCFQGQLFTFHLCELFSLQFIFLLYFLSLLVLIYPYVLVSSYFGLLRCSRFSLSPALFLSPFILGFFVPSLRPSALKPAATENPKRSNCLPTEFNTQFSLHESILVVQKPRGSLSHLYHFCPPSPLTPLFSFRTSGYVGSVRAIL